MIFVMIMVFIGGLLVLLVGVSSTTSQEQSIPSSNLFLWMILGVSSLMLSLEIKLFLNVFQVFLFSWLSWSPMALFLIMSILILSLCLMTWLAISYKGSLRGLYYYLI